MLVVSLQRLTSRPSSCDSARSNHGRPRFRGTPTPTSSGPRCGRRSRWSTQWRFRRSVGRWRPPGRRRADRPIDDGYDVFAQMMKRIGPRAIATSSDISPCIPAAPISTGARTWSCSCDRPTRGPFTPALRHRPRRALHHQHLGTRATSQFPPGRTTTDYAATLFVRRRYPTTKNPMIAEANRGSAAGMGTVVSAKVGNEEGSAF